MSFIDQALDPIKIPKFVKVRQNFPRPVVADAAAELRAKLTRASSLRASRPA